MVLLSVVTAFGYLQSKLDKINKVSDTVDVIPPEQEEFEIDTGNTPQDIIELKPEEVDWSEIEPFLDDNLLNILLVDQDRRKGEGRQRSDSMILCSINPDTKQISMISFLRDLYVQIPGGYSDNRLNAAYVFGGFPLLMDTLHTNFGVTIHQDNRIVHNRSAVLCGSQQRLPESHWTVSAFFTNQRGHIHEQRNHAGNHTAC